VILLWVRMIIPSVINESEFRSLHLVRVWHI
jgi:hypothetical protein